MNRVIKIDFEMVMALLDCPEFCKVLKEEFEKNPITLPEIKPEYPIFKAHSSPLKYNLVN